MCIDRVYSFLKAMCTITVACGVGKASCASLSIESSARSNVRLTMSQDGDNFKVSALQGDWFGFFNVKLRKNTAKMDSSGQRSRDRWCKGRLTKMTESTSTKKIPRMPADTACGQL